MKNFKTLSVLLLAAVIGAFSSCKKEEEVKPVVVKDLSAYVVNYGTYDGVKGELSIYDEKAKTIQNGAYKSANNVDFSSCIQSLAIHNNVAYMMSNNGDKIDIVDAKTLTASVNPISEDITKPRYFVADGTTGYISCWGNIEDWSNIENSYIAVVDLSAKKVTKKIMIANGPEGVTIANGKLYVALAFTNQVAVVDLGTEAVSYIDVNAVPKHFVKDSNGNLWVTLVSTYSNSFGSDKVGLAVIDTQNDVVTDNVNFEGIGGSGYLAINGSKTKIYVMGAEAWPGTKTNIFEVDVNAKTIGSSALVEGENYYGMGCNSQTDKLYVLISPSTSENGKLQVYSTDGTLENEVETGIAPQHVVFY